MTVPATSARPTVVLHVFGQMNRGGRELRTLEVVRNLDPAHVCSLFCVLSGMPGTLDDEIRRLGGDVLYCPLGPGFGRRFRSLLRTRRVDAVHSHIHHFSGYLLLLARITGVRIRIVHIATDSDGHQATLRRRLQRAVMKWAVDANATHILAVGKAAMAHGWREDWNRDRRCEIVPNGLDLAPFRVPADPTVRRDIEVAEDDTLVLHVGRPILSKNRARAVAILAELCKRDPKRRYALAFVGGRTTEDDRELGRVASELAVSDRIRLTGERSDVPRLLKAADLLLVPSTREGLPGVVIEAWAAGTPVLASDLPGVVEVTHYTHLVRSIPLSDPDPEWAANALERLSLDRSADARGNALIEFELGPFSLDKATERLTTIWRAG